MAILPLNRLEILSWSVLEVHGMHSTVRAEVNQNLLRTTEAGGVQSIGGVGNLCCPVLGAKDLPELDPATGPKSDVSKDRGRVERREMRRLAVEDQQSCHQGSKTLHRCLRVSAPPRAGGARGMGVASASVAEKVVHGAAVELPGPSPVLRNPG